MCQTGKKLSAFAAMAWIVLGGTSTASAADIPMKAPTAFVPADLVYNWSGWYLGLNGGYVERDGANVFGTPISNDGSSGAATPYAGLAASAATGFIPRSKGWLGGAQEGYNWAVNRVLFGVEVDIDGVSARSSSTVVALTPAAGFPTFPISSSFVGSQKLDYIGTVRGRMGFLMGTQDTFLVYATGGLAYGGVSSSAAVNYIISPAGGCSACTTGSAVISSSTTRVGWTAGGGGEWMFAPNWSLKAEGLYYDLGSFSNSGTLSNINTTSGLSYLVTGVRVDNRTTGAIARVGINFHFGEGAGY